MAKILTNSDKGREIFDYLARELGVPRGCTRLIVVFDMEDVIRYSGDFMAEEKEDNGDKIIETFVSEIGKTYGY